MRAEAAVNRLMELHPKGFDLSLGRVTELLENLGNPHLSIPPVFHVAGTNGKGSTIAFLRAVLEAAGKTVHVHTSPHLVNWSERYRIGQAGGGRFVSDEELAAVIDHVATVNGGKRITVFEIMSAVGFVLFAKHQADFCILEVGLGGRFDATNVIVDPAASIITPIGLDHEAYLGNTIEKISFEKAGIIKPGAPVIVGVQEEAALEVIERRAAELKCPVRIARQDFDFYEQAGRFVFQDETGLLDLPMPALSGQHQLANAALAISACRQVLPDLDDVVYDKAMQAVSWPGRFERLKPGKLTVNSNDPECWPETRPEMWPEIWPEIWIDGGHNPHAGRALAAGLRKLQARDPKPLVLVAGMLTTKEPNGFFHAFDGMVDKVLTLPVNDSDAGFEPEALAGIVRKCGFEAEPMKDIESALLHISQLYPGKQCRVLICGSLYLVGEILGKNGTPPV